MKILTFSTLFPNPVQKRHGVFVENRLRHLLADGSVQSKVIAPVPWFPFRHRVFGAYADFAGVPEFERRNDVEVYHPRYLIIPKLGMTLTPWLMARAVAPSLRKLIREGYDFDLIDAHYFYPDGVAAALLARELGKPLVITARGTDLNLIPRYALPRRMIQWAAGRASAMITVCQALKDVLVEMDVAPERVTVLRNGVDLEMFRPPEERDSLRDRLDIRHRTILSVGHLIERKGHDLVIRSLGSLPDVELLIAGDGEEEANLKSLAAELGVADRIRFLGAVSHDDLRLYYGAVDILVLASSREGWANVLLESMACGTPVVASNVWGTPEVVARPEAGMLTPERTPESIAATVKALLQAYPDRAAVRSYAEGFSWDATTRGQLELFTRVMGEAR